MPHKNPITCSLYKRWAGMLARCYNPSSKAFTNYGGRGIRVCHQWKFSFRKFEAWALSSGFDLSLYLDRKDVNGNYNPRNCRWVDSSENIRNRRWTPALATQIANARKNVNVSKLKAAVFRAHAKPVRCVETGEVFESAVAASRFAGVSAGHICNVINGAYESKAGGYRWERTTNAN